MKIAQLAERAHDIQDLMPLGQQISRQARPKRAGSFNPKGFDMTELRRPYLEILIPFSCRGNTRAAQTSAVRVDGYGNVVGFGECPA